MIIWLLNHTSAVCSAELDVSDLLCLAKIYMNETLTLKCIRIGWNKFFLGNCFH